MATNNISATFSQEDVQSVLTDITNIEGKMPFLVNATLKDKRAKQIMGPTSYGYVQYGITTAKNNAEILARSFSVEEYQKDSDTNNGLLQIYNRLLPLTQKIKDTLLLLGQDLMDQTNEVYGAVKREVKNNGNLKAVADEMGKRYEVSHKEEPVEAKATTHLN